MSLVALVAIRLALAGVFCVAGIAKLIDGTGSRQALIGFGFPSWLAKPLGTLLPLTELVVATMLMLADFAWLGAVGALFLLLGFVIAITINLLHGRAPECHCFGQLHSAPAGLSTLIRNGLLACAAGLLVWRWSRTPVQSLFSWFSALTAPERVALLSVIFVLALLAAQAVLLLEVLKQQGRILLRLDALEANRASGQTRGSPQSTAGLPVGAPAPAFRLSDLRGQSITLDDLLTNQKPVLLLFTNPNCGPCQALLPEISQWQRQHRAKLTIALLSEGLPAENQSKAGHELSKLLLQQKREVAELYQAWGTPAAVLIRPDGSISSPLAQGAEAIRLLVERSVSGVVPTSEAAVPWLAAGGADGNGHHAASRQILKLGDPAPRLALLNLEGEAATLTDFGGQGNLILFWNPQCGYCQQMLNDLRNWDASPPAEAPRLIVFSTGTIEDARAMGLRSRVLIDARSQAAMAFGAGGTPTAVLLGADLTIASEIAAGAQAVFALANANAKSIEA